MQQNFSEVTYLTIIISTVLLFIFSSLLMFYFTQIQKRKFRHQQEVLELRDSFNQILLQSKLEIQEQTLDHIAKELHANFSHLVSLININLSAILAESNGSVRDHIIETKFLAKQLMADLKVLSVSLNSDHIMKTGFLKALEKELDRLRKTGKYDVTQMQTGQTYHLRPERGIILFRLCQEILNNIVKHSDAKTIKVSLDYTLSSLNLIISDDGKGFDLEASKINRDENESTGLMNIANRAKLINAELTIQSTIGSGTTVTVIIPNL